VAVQEDLKIDEKKVAEIKKLGEDAVKTRTKTRATVTLAAAKQAQAQAAQQQAAMAEQLTAAGIPFDAKSLAAAANNNNGGGRGGRGGNGGPGGGQNNQVERQMMTMAMDALQAKVDAVFLKLLTPKQKDRLKQILLQQEGARAFTGNPPNQEVVTKLGLTDEQLVNIQTLNNELRQTQRASMQEFMTSFATANNIDITNNNNNGGGRGGNRGGGGGGFINPGNLDETTRAKYTTAMGDFQARSSAATMEAIGGLLTKTQQGKFNALVGAKFDVSKLRGPLPGAPGAPGTTTATAPGATPTTTTPATTKAAPKGRPSLKDTRGGN
jgi:hypothetical protein